MENKKVIETLKNTFKEKILETSVQFGDDVISIEKSALLDIMNFLKNEPHDFSLLLDLTCVDYLGEEKRFEMVYHVFSIASNQRLRIKIRLPESNLSIDSLAALWKNANW